LEIKEEEKKEMEEMKRRKIIVRRWSTEIMRI
jgi:hypothetical protein